MTKRNCIIVDIDMTIADCRHRMHLKPEQEPGYVGDWTAWHEAIPGDTPIDFGSTILEGLKEVYYKPWIVFATARNEKYRQQTIDWLKANNFWTLNSFLLMRSENDRDSSVIVKEKQLKKFQGTMEEFGVHCRFVAAMNDNKKELEMYGKFGIPGIDTNFFIND